jgi:hypothetical protein
MRRSSKSIGTIAGALAKAHAELTNPEKLLTATIRSRFRGRAIGHSAMQSLSNGLDIVRKAAAIDEAGTRRLCFRNFSSCPIVAAKVPLELSHQVLQST